MTNVNSSFIDSYGGGTFLSARDLTPGVPTTGTIKDVRKVEFQQSGDVKPALDFFDLDKTFPLNKTQTRSLVELFGNEPSQWIGKQISMMAVPSNYQGKPTIAITAANGTPPPATPVGPSPEPPPAFPSSESPSLQGNAADEVSFG